MIINVAPLLKQAPGTREHFEIEEAPIDPRGENAGLLEAAVVDIEARLDATHTTPGAYLEGTAAAHVAAQCSRCLAPIDTPVSAEFAEQYYATVGVESGAALDTAPRDAKTIGSDFKIDLTPLLCEEIILATPLAPLCRPDCRGLCPVCGEDLNQALHVHDDAVDARWSKLQELKEASGPTHEGPLPLD